MKKNILIVEDEAHIRDLVRFILSPFSEYEVIEAGDVAEAKSIVNERVPDLILLDWMLPDKSGIDFITELKAQERGRDIPIIMLTAKAEESNKVKGLRVGADDYITKPFSPRELVARIAAMLRRGPIVTPDNIIHVQDLTINVKTHEVMAAETLLKLTPIDYKLLHFFVTHQDRVYTRAQLLDRVWGENVYVEERTVDVQIKRLRQVLREYEYDKFIQTVRGAGYKFSMKN